MFSTPDRACQGSKTQNQNSSFGKSKNGNKRGGEEGGEKCNLQFVRSPPTILDNHGLCMFFLGALVFPGESTGNVLVKPSQKEGGEGGKKGFRALV